jgi:hypothetical protein
MLAAIARGLRLTLDERDHLFQLAGRNAPHRALRADHVNPGMMRVLDRLYDTPAQVVTGLDSPEFERVWDAHEVGLIRSDLKRLVHPELGVLELHCQMLVDFDQSQALLVFTATPGSESYEKLQLLSVIGEQRLDP